MPSLRLYRAMHPRHSIDPQGWQAFLRWIRSQEFAYLRLLGRIK